MEILKSFDSNFAINLQGDLQILNKENIKVVFQWQDLENQIVFPTSPTSGRHNELWKQTCFEAFLRLKNRKKKQYYEVNLSTNKAWNFYEFQEYRKPQPPVEFHNVKKIEIYIENNQLSANISVRDLDLTQIEVSLCAVLQLKDGRTTYWSTFHADAKPNFHHIDSFTIERQI